MHHHYRTLIVLGSVLFLASCGGCNHAELEREAALLAQENAQLRKQAAESKTGATDRKNELVHIVWFKLKPELTGDQIDSFVNEIYKLDQIDFVDELEVGKFADLGDDRAMSELQLVMSMKFDSEELYQAYQAHQIHLDLKKAAGEFLAGPPVTYDYWTVSAR